MKTLKIAIGVLIIAALAVSCIPKEETMGSAGQTLVKLNPSSGFVMLAIDAKTTAQTVVLFDVRRDVPSNAALNDASVSVTLKYDTDTAILKAYNTANATNFIPLPTSLGTVSPAFTSGQINFNFAAGEFAKSFIVNLPSSASFDFSKTYALAFKLVSVSGSGTLSSLTKTVVCQIVAKNKYDGKYLLKGLHNRVPYNFPYVANMQMLTAGASSVAFYWEDAGSVGHPIGTGVGTLSWYGASIAPVVVFDPVTNLVTDVYNSGGATPITKFTGAGANSNLYDPATKTIYVSWNYNNNPLRAFIDTLTYTGVR
jgi:hypothetical protein